VKALGGSTDDPWQRWKFLPKETRSYLPDVLAIEVAYLDWLQNGRVRSPEERLGIRTATVSSQPKAITIAKKAKATSIVVVPKGSDTTPTRRTKGRVEVAQR